jgi:hypothetical protein
MPQRKHGKGADETAKKPGLYRRLMVWVFQNKEPDEETGELHFSQADLRQAAAALGEEARNFPDLPYNMRSRAGLPQELLDAGYSTIAIRGKGQYALVTAEDKFDVPQDTPVVDVSTEPIPAAIRDILRTDEQSILSVMRYLDTVSDFMGRPAHHLQGHLRTTGSLKQQVEADDVWVAEAVEPDGQRTMLPIETKAMHERLGLHQMISTIDAVLKKYPAIPVVPLAAQLENSGLLLMVEFNYQLARGRISNITPTRFKRYRLNPKLPLWPPGVLPAPAQ